MAMGLFRTYRLVTLLRVDRHYPTPRLNAGRMSIREGGKRHYQLQ